MVSVLPVGEPLAWLMAPKTERVDFEATRAHPPAQIDAGQFDYSAEDAAMAEE